MRRIALPILAAVLGVGAATAGTGWTNPRSLPQEWVDYGIGDPFILRFNGTYYLYPSTRDDLVGVKVWSSTDLVEWTYRGLCTTEPLTKGAYAPEVTYWNGTFHMVTSPAGRGHYVLTSTSPTGPFVLPPNSVNQGRSIDGSVFVDDDASMWFAHAGDPAILVNRMSSPLALDGKDVASGASLAGWTEGPSIWKRHGLHYMTYTGNHLFSHGYRVAYAISRTGPQGPYVPAANNPILVSTEDGFYGLGHSSSFVGPDLDTWYMTYHNLHQPMSPWRHFSIDPMVWDGDELSVLGPTHWEQPPPARPAFEDRFDRREIGPAWRNTGGGRWGVFDSSLLWQDSTGSPRWHRQISTATSASDFTAEFNLKEMGRGGDEARLGALFSWTGEDDFGQVVLSSFHNRIETDIRRGGRWIGRIAADLPPGFDHRAWHCLRLEKKGDSLQVWVDGMRKIVRSAAGLGGGSIGLATLDDHADFGYVAFSDKVDGSGASDLAKPIPGRLLAAHHTGMARSRRTPFPDGGTALEGITSDDPISWTINTKAAGLHSVAIRYAAASSTTARLSIDGVATGGVDLPATGGTGIWRTRLAEGIPLPGGIHTLSLRVESGSIGLRDLQLAPMATRPPSLSEDFATGFSAAWNYVDGSWSIDGGQAVATGYGKRLLGDPGWTDYAVEADVWCPASGNAGLLLRAANPSNGGAGDDPKLGTDFVQGYYAGLQEGRVILGRENYGWTELASAPIPTAAGAKAHLKVVAEGDRLRVFVDDTSRARIDVIDRAPRHRGRAGLRSFGGPSRFHDFQVSPRLPTRIASEAPPRSRSIFGDHPRILLISAERASIPGLPDGTPVVVRDLSGRTLVKGRIREGHIALPRPGVGLATLEIVSSF